MGNLEHEVKKRRGAAKLPGWLCDRIKAKCAHHERSYRKRLNSIAYPLMSQPSLCEQAADVPEVSLFFRSHVAIALSSSELTNELWCPKTEEGKDSSSAERPIGWVKIARYEDRLLIMNPLSRNVESWARPSSVSRPLTESSYSRHYENGGSKQKSLFFGNYEFIKPLEYVVFNRGVGLLLTATTMHLYAEFEKPIGKSTKGDLLKHMRLVVTRERRPPVRKNDVTRKTGWMVRIHGYPVGIEDLKILRGNTEFNAGLVPKLTNPSFGRGRGVRGVHHRGNPRLTTDL